MDSATDESQNDPEFCKFCCQLLHSSLAKILETLKPGMMTLEIARFPDGNFRKVVFGLGPYIADYPKQALLACIVQGWCPKYVLNLVFLKSLLICLCRCTAPGDNLDSSEYICRSQSHSELLVEEFKLGMLWDKYGLVGDIVISVYSHFCDFCLVQLFKFPVLNEITFFWCDVICAPTIQEPFNWITRLIAGKN